MSTNSLPKLQIHLLGAPQISCKGLACAQNMPAKAQAVLYYLAMTGRAHTRAALAGLLWSEHGEEEARRNLRKTIQELRRHLEPFLAIDYHTAGLRSPEVCWVDAVEFAAWATAPQPLHTEQLQAALALYRADFLEGFHVRDAPAFETWMLGERARLRELLLGRLATLASRHAAEGDLPQAIACLRRLLELEPWREEAHRQLMAWLAQSGQRNAALVQYDLCCRALVDELGVEPDAATRELHTRLLQADAPSASAFASPVPLPQQPVTVVDYTLVGRKEAWQTLRTAWSKAVQAGAHMVAIGGEAGIGKTRLAEELLLYVQRQGYATARARAYALEGRLSYAPLADWLRTPPLQARLGKLERVWLSEAARLLPELLIEHPDLPAPEPLTERWQQKRLFEALRHAFTADTRPLLLLLDDLQWCDAETLAFLQYLVETAPQVPLLVVGTVRSDELDEQHSLHQLRRALLRAGRLSTVDLSPLSAEETAALAAEVGEYALDSGAATRLYQATAGNPLFVVETVRAGDQVTGLARHAGLHTEVPADTQSVLGLPPKVYAVIEARLAQLSPAARTLSQVAATIGRAFTLPLIVEASRENEEVVVAGLDELWQRRIVREQGADSYDFSHDLIRETAYISISSARRRLLHRRVAEALEQAGPGEHPSSAQIAWHYVQAGLPEKAVTHYSQAAATAHQMYASQDAIGYLNKALDLLATLPPTAERGEQVIDLLSTLGTAWSVVKTYAAFEAKHAFDRAFALGRQQAASPRLFIALWGLHVFHLARAEYERSLHTAEECLRIAQDLQDPALLIEAHHAMWGSLAFMNRYRAAVDHVDQALLWYNREQHHLLALQYAGHDPGHCALSIAAVCLCLSGFPSQARRRLQEAIELAAHFSIPSSLADAAFNQAMICQLLDDTPAALHWAEITIRQSTDHSYRLGQAMGTALAGWAMAKQGEYAEGLTLLQRGMVQWQNEGMRHMQTYLFALWIEACCVAGAIERGIAGAVEAHNYLIEYQEHFYAPEIYRLHGDLLQLQAQNSEAEVYYQQAITLARQQAARSLELRAAVSLARLWQGQGTPRKAYDLLAPVYAWFTEGFDTVDLQEAKALLDQLS